METVLERRTDVKKSIKVDEILVVLSAVVAYLVNQMVEVVVDGVTLVGKVVVNDGVCQVVCPDVVSPVNFNAFKVVQVHNNGRVVPNLAVRRVDFVVAGQVVESVVVNSTDEVNSESDVSGVR